jgi:hypothetical protein
MVRKIALWSIALSFSVSSYSMVADDSVSREFYKDIAKVFDQILSPQGLVSTNFDQNNHQFHLKFSTLEALSKFLRDHTKIFVGGDPEILETSVSLSCENALWLFKKLVPDERNRLSLLCLITMSPLNDTSIDSDEEPDYPIIDVKDVKRSMNENPL